MVLRVARYICLAAFSFVLSFFWPRAYNSAAVAVFIASIALWYLGILDAG